jgi:hypothetical protein
MAGMSGSGPFGAGAQMAWFGHVWQASPCPACIDSRPGQCSGSGATSWFVPLSYGGSSREGAIVVVVLMEMEEDF